VIAFDHPETAYDVKFRVGSIPVRVHPFFWLTALLLGWHFSRPPYNLGYLLLWVACCFVSVLLHELGHVWMGMIFGTRAHIVLWSFGGVAVGSNHLDDRWKRIVVSLAGPGIQLVLYGILWLAVPSIIVHTPDDWKWPVAVLLSMLMWVNLYWPLLNLLPIWPMDGGMIARELCVAVSPRKGIETSLLISIGVAGVLAIQCLMADNDMPLIPYLGWVRGTFLGIWFAIDCVQSIQLYQMERSRRNPWDSDLPWER
jgi:Zn-dependent protease